MPMRFEIYVSQDALTVFLALNFRLLAPKDKISLPSKYLHEHTPKFNE